jgi:peptidoglycan hydrolase-like protein with peptidoglycan-binding domain
LLAAELVEAVRARGVLGIGFAVGALVLAGPASASPQQAGVQVALRALGLYCGPIDGVVGPQTRAAVLAAQKRAGLPQTGALGPRTRGSLGPLGMPRFGSRPITPGDFGLDVSVLQFLLAHDGYYRGGLDGYFGPRLLAAVKAFQRHRGLSADGIAGPETLAALTARHRAASAGPRRIYVVRPGDSLTAVAARFGTTVPALAQANKLDAASVLLIGTRLRLPASPGLTATPSDVQARLTTWADRLGVSPDLVRALAWMESGYQPSVVSSVGARGVMQVMPETRDFVEHVLVGRQVPHTVDGDIEVGVLYLRHLLGQFDGDTRLALAAWYQGEAAVRHFGLYQMTKPFVADVLALQSRM